MSTVSSTVIGTGIVVVIVTVAATVVDAVTLTSGLLHLLLLPWLWPGLLL